MRLTILALLALPMLSAGCVGPSLAKMVKAMGNDPATVSLTISTVYGTVKFVRTNPGTNSATVAPDGTVTVNR